MNLIMDVWTGIVGIGILAMLPLYIVLQIWFPIAWKGRWRLLALLPLLVMVPLAAWELPHSGNLSGIFTIMLAPVAAGYLIAIAVVRREAMRRAA
jgi:hypothetical protein